MSLVDHNAVVGALVASLAAALPARHVEPSLIVPENEKSERLQSGVVCVVSRGGGKFASYRGREGQLGTMDVALVGFLQVDHKLASAAVQAAELALLNELLQWVSTAAVAGLDSVVPGDWRQSGQLEHPFGWLVLELKVKT